MVEEGCILRMVDDPFTEKELRVHLTRFREQLTDFKNGGSTTAASTGIDVVLSCLSVVSDGFGNLNPISFHLFFSFSSFIYLSFVLAYDYIQ